MALAVIILVSPTTWYQEMLWLPGMRMPAVGDPVVGARGERLEVTGVDTRELEPELLLEVLGPRTRRSEFAGKSWLSRMWRGGRWVLAEGLITDPQGPWWRRGT